MPLPPHTTPSPGLPIDNRWPPLPALKNADDMTALMRWYYDLQLQLNRQFLILKEAVDKLTPTP